MAPDTKGQLIDELFDRDILSVSYFLNATVDGAHDSHL